MVVEHSTLDHCPYLLNDEGIEGWVVVHSQFRSEILSSKEF
jgi:hypothetical protein